MKLLSVQIGMPKKLGKADAADPMDRPWESSFYKEPVCHAVLVGKTGLAGDGQADLKNHGGPDKAINAYPTEHFAYWKEHLNLDCQPGAFGENFSTSELDEDEVFVGDVFRVGEATVQITQPRQPCWKLDRRWRIKGLAAQVQRTGRTGWYFRVIDGGMVEAPQEFQLIERPHPEWSIAQANSVMHHRKGDWESALRLSSCNALSESWKKTLRTRGLKHQVKEDDARLAGGEV